MFNHLRFDVGESHILIFFKKILQIKIKRARITLGWKLSLNMLDLECQNCSPLARIHQLDLLAILLALWCEKMIHMTLRDF